MIRKLIFGFIFLNLFSIAQAAPCSFPDGNWEITVKGNDPTVKAQIGLPTTGIFLVPDGDGCYRHHQSGSIYWNQQAGTHFVKGAIRQKWSALGWEKSFLRYPTTDETATPDGAGRFNHFQGGSIYWHPSTGAHEVHGDIIALWSSIGWERSVLGYPTTDETVLPDGKGRANHFQNGAIYWKPNLGPHYVMGALSFYYETHGHETNASYGYPITNELAPKPGSPNRFSDFENGVLYWKARTGAVSELGPFPLASRSKDEIEEAARDQVAALMAPHADEAYVDSEPVVTGTTDYKRSGFNGVLNREIQLNLRIKYKASFLGIDGALPDPYTDLTLWAAFSKRSSAGGTEIVMTLTRAYLRTTVPSPTNVFISPGTINNKLKNDVLKDVIGKPQVQGTVPSSLTVLSVKVMSNGDLRTFIEPL